MDLTTSFNILGIAPGTDEAQAKRAYKTQVRRWHPDQFPEGSPTKAGAEEQLKQINIAYARVRAFLASHRPDPGVTAADTRARHGEDAAVYPEEPGEKSKKRPWVDHLFDALNAFAGSRTGGPPEPPTGEAEVNRRKTFGQVLDEMAGGNVSSTPKRQTGKRADSRRRNAAGYRHYHRRGSTVGAVGGTERPGPVKPVSRVRGIGRNR